MPAVDGVAPAAGPVPAVDGVVPAAGVAPELGVVPAIGGVLPAVVVGPEPVVVPVRSPPVVTGRPLASTPVGAPGPLVDMPEPRAVPGVLVATSRPTAVSVRFVPAAGPVVAPPEVTGLLWVATGIAVPVVVPAAVPVVVPAAGPVVVPAAVPVVVPPEVAGLLWVTTGIEVPGDVAVLGEVKPAPTGVPSLATGDVVIPPASMVGTVKSKAPSGLTAAGLTVGMRAERPPPFPSREPKIPSDRLPAFWPVAMLVSGLLSAASGIWMMVLARGVTPRRKRGNMRPRSRPTLAKMPTAPSPRPPRAPPIAPPIAPPFSDSVSKPLRLPAAIWLPWMAESRPTMNPTPNAAPPTILVARVRAMFTRPYRISWATSVRSRTPMPTRAAAINPGTRAEPNNDENRTADVAASTPSIPMIMILVFWMSAAAFSSISV
ncbi:hypothetical protein OG205_16630 [Lentzea sp. NBC_00516]|uniref:hypothetical protein n=1 Tax=Lentzea sp. NBC_00516 TaxID=2903582 RepID=UPI002E824B2B|nr:hypothetical protein [Lentzea sp. NBC_00516]WUD28561.1 hypothetical protein OG205_16630 [Lentzea sp. NBC_00516]